MATTVSGTGGQFREGPLTEPQDAALTRSGAARIGAIDMMRGLVIAIMVLDHVRDYFHIDASSFDPTDAARSYPLLYLTRWVTHLCAPTFVLLAGVSIWMQRENGKTGGRLTRFLVSRGLWLVALEVTVISFAWNFGPPAFMLQVIWAIGWSMIIMALFARLPSQIGLIVGAAFCLLYPLLILAVMGMPGPDNPPSLPMQILFTGGLYAPAYTLILYPILPWTGIMLLGFGLGPVFAMESARRRRWLTMIGLGLIAFFFVMRGLNGYGDPRPWHRFPDGARTAMDFFNVLKYPPVPDFVAVTLGVSMLLFTAVERLRGRLADILLTFGRTPLFTYVLHIFIVHAAMLATVAALGRPQLGIGFLRQLLTNDGETAWGVPLWAIYPIWLAVLAALIPLSRWMADLKRRRRDWWLSYI